MCKIKEKCVCLNKLRKEVEILRSEVKSEIEKNSENLLKDCKLYKAGSIVGLNDAIVLIEKTLNTETKNMWFRSLK